MKVIINRQFGGFHVSEAGYERYAELKGIQLCNHREGSAFNDCFYFDIPKDEFDRLEAQCGENWEAKNALYEKHRVYLDGDYRTDPTLIQVVEELGEEADTQVSDLKVIEIPDDIGWEVHDYDGMESIHEIHRVWN
jgi:hypothetical protein